MSDVLKPCAHCGKAAITICRRYRGNDFWRVVCTGCGIGTYCDGQGLGHMKNKDGLELAILEWNSRTE